MTGQFDQLIVSVKQKFIELYSSTKKNISDLPKDMPIRGIYLFSEGNKPLYVGRTNNLRKRLQYHTRSNHNQATFAFLLARHQTGILKASYQQKGSRQDLLNNSMFRTAFEAARKRIKEMDVQYVEETDPVKQAILEVYTAFETKAQYNDFDNH